MCPELLLCDQLIRYLREWSVGQVYRIYLRCQNDYVNDRYTCFTSTPAIVMLRKASRMWSAVVVKQFYAQRTSWIKWPQMDKQTDLLKSSFSFRDMPDCSLITRSSAFFESGTFSIHQRFETFYAIDHSQQLNCVKWCLFGKFYF